MASAIVHGTLDGLGANHLEQVAFGEIGAAALGATAHLSLGSLLGEGNYVDKTQIQLSVDLTAAVAADYANRTARANLTQYRVGFSEVLANGHWDDIELPTNDIRLLTTYLVP